MLEVEFDSYNGEAFYNDKMDEIVTLLEEKHLLTENQGAEIVDLTEYNLNPALIQIRWCDLIYHTGFSCCALP